MSQITDATKVVLPMGIALGVLSTIIALTWTGRGTYDEITNRQALIEAKLEEVLTKEDLPALERAVLARLASRSVSISCPNFPTRGQNYKSCSFKGLIDIEGDR